MNGSSTLLMEISYERTSWLDNADGLRKAKKVYRANSQIGKCVILGKGRRARKGNSDFDKRRVGILRP
jgi:hypothetical protein